MWEKIDQRLEKLQWSAADLARALGVTSQHVTNWRRRGLPPARAIEISRALKMPADWLFEAESNHIEDAASAELKAQTTELVDLFVQLGRRDRLHLIDIAALFLDNYQDHRHAGTKRRKD